MIDLHLNDIPYDKPLDNLFERVSNENSIKALSRAPSDESSEKEHNIFAMAQAITERAYRHRLYRRSSRII